MKSRRHSTVSWKPPLVVWQLLINSCCWESQCSGWQEFTVWPGVIGCQELATVIAMDYCSFRYTQNLNYASPTIVQIARQAQVQMDASSFKKVASHQLCHHLTKRHFWCKNHQGEVWSWVLNESSNGVVTAMPINQTSTQAECGQTTSKAEHHQIEVLWVCWCFEISYVKLLSADWLRINWIILLSTGMPSKKWSTMLP